VDDFCKISGDFFVAGKHLKGSQGITTQMTKRVEGGGSTPGSIGRKGVGEIYDSMKGEERKGKSLTRLKS